MPVDLVVALFAAFIAEQLTVLFGGGDRVRQTAGPTYTKYARSGFWQLLTVTMLVLGVIAGPACPPS